MALRIGVSCRGCGSRIEVEDQYVAGTRVADLAPVLFGHAPNPSLRGPVTDLWEKTLSCADPHCQRTSFYTREDLCLYEE